MRNRTVSNTVLLLLSIILLFVLNLLLALSEYLSQRSLPP